MATPQISDKRSKNLASLMREANINSVKENFKSANEKIAEAIRRNRNVMRRGNSIRRDSRRNDSGDHRRITGFREAFGEKGNPDMRSGIATVQLAGEDQALRVANPFLQMMAANEAYNPGMRDQFSEIFGGATPERQFVDRSLQQIEMERINQGLDGDGSSFNPKTNREEEIGMINRQISALRRSQPTKEKMTVRGDNQGKTYDMNQREQDDLAKKRDALQRRKTAMGRRDYLKTIQNENMIRKKAQDLKKMKKPTTANVPIKEIIQK